MFPDIHSALRLDKYSIQNKRINIVQEPSTDGSFLLHHFISSSIKSNYNVLILSFEQTIGHFHGVGMKLGYDLIKLQKKGQLIFYDGLKSAHDSYLKDQNESDVCDIINLCSESSGSLTKLLNAIEEKTNKFENTSLPVVIIIENISSFLTLGIKLACVINFLVQLQSFVQEKDGTLGKIQKQHKFSIKGRYQKPILMAHITKK